MYKALHTPSIFCPGSQLVSLRSLRGPLRYLLAGQQRCLPSSAQERFMPFVRVIQHTLTLHWLKKGRVKEEVWKLVKGHQVHLSHTPLFPLSGDYLVMHLSELVRTSFIAATASVDQLKLAGYEALRVCRHSCLLLYLLHHYYTMCCPL